MLVASHFDLLSLGYLSQNIIFLLIFFNYLKCKNHSYFKGHMKTGGRLDLGYWLCLLTPGLKDIFCFGQL